MLEWRFYSALESSSGPQMRLGVVRNQRNCIFSSFKILLSHLIHSLATLWHVINTYQCPFPITSTLGIYFSYTPLKQSHYLIKHNCSNIKLINRLTEWRKLNDSRSCGPESSHKMISANKCTPANESVPRTPQFEISIKFCVSWRHVEEKKKNCSKITTQSQAS